MPSESLSRTSHSHFLDNQENQLSYENTRVLFPVRLAYYLVIRISGRSLAPSSLVKAHAEIDRAVDLCYRPQQFENDGQRVEFIFALHEKLTAPLIAATEKKRSRKVPNSP